MGIKPLFQPSKAVPTAGPVLPSVTTFLKDLFPLQGLFSIGALFQCGVSHLLPGWYALLPAVATFCTVVVAKGMLYFIGAPNSYNGTVVPGIVSAQLPNRETGAFDEDPASTGLVVLHVGARFNHPLGALAPGVQEFSRHFTDMNVDLQARAEELGLYSITSWGASQAATTNAIMNIYYFRDLASVSKFAHGPIHRKAWSWFKQEKHPHIGVFHEVYDVPARGWETSYSRMPPTLLGAGTVPCTDAQTNETVWVSPLVDGSTPAMRGMLRRMGRKAP